MSNHLVLCHPLLLLSSIFPSIRVFSNESVLHISWPKYQSFSIIPSNEFSGLISFRMDWLDLFAVQGTLKSLLQHHSSKTSNLQLSAFFIVQLPYPQKVTGTVIPLIRQTFVGTLGNPQMVTKYIIEYMQLYSVRFQMAQLISLIQMYLFLFKKKTSLQKETLV